MATIAINENTVTIKHSAWGSIAGTVEVPIQAVTRATVNKNEVRVHVEGAQHAAPSATEIQYNKYAAVYFDEVKAANIANKINKAVEAHAGEPAPAGWAPAPHHRKVQKLAAKKTFEQWEIETRGAIANAGSSRVSQIGELVVKSDATVEFRGETYSIKGARAAVDTGLANNKKFNAGRVTAGVIGGGLAATVAGPVGAAVFAPTLIRDQKGTVAVEVTLADGRTIFAAGPSGKGGKENAQSVAQAINAQAGIAAN